MEEVDRPNVRVHLRRAFIGPGLLDLASWHGTLDDPQPERVLGLIESYVAAGGSQQALAMRGGLAVRRS